MNYVETIKQPKEVAPREPKPATTPSSRAAEQSSQGLSKEKKETLYPNVDG